MKYVLKLQEVQEKKKFEFVEILLSYMLGWLTFYHQGYVDLEEFRLYDNDLRLFLQKTRENFNCTRDEAQSLMSRMLNENKALKPSDQSGTLKEKRFCFDVTLKEKSVPLTFQALSDDDRRLWLEAMDVNSLIKIALDPKESEKVNFDDPSVWETKTITNAVKNYLRSLPEPLMTFQLHENFIKAAKQESKTLRILDIHKYVHLLPEPNFKMLELLIGHLKRVSDQCEVNKMTVANLGVCFRPSLMRPEEESMAAIMDIQFCNIVVEILINNYEQIFKTPPDGTDISESRVLNVNQSAPKTPVSASSNSGELLSKSTPSGARNVNHSAN
ncbi:Rho GTPase-activating protein 26 [Bulinus truncatus]|nr:Rho GTPase-activating protein 26 [Bulinus truncatus]